MSRFIKDVLLRGSVSMEQELFAQYASEKCPAVFVVCAPRVGSTLIYQLLANKFGFSYISNFVNDYFSETPVVGYSHLDSRNINQYLVSYESQYGKTLAGADTSEGSAVLGNWFGGEHPSQENSAAFLSSEKILHAQQSISSIYGITHSPFLSKNPWNSFRIKALSTFIPDSVFIWIKRDIYDASISDLENRYSRGNPSLVWNSATTSNYLDIQTKPYYEQVVLQQYWYSQAIESALREVESNRFIEIMYEDLCESPVEQLEKCGQIFPSSYKLNEKTDFEYPSLKVASGGMNKLSAADLEKVRDIVNSDEKYMQYRHPRLAHN